MWSLCQATSLEISSMESKTICIVAPSLQIGGIERALTTLADHFVKRGHKVYYVACRAGDHFYSLNPKVIFVEPEYKHRLDGLHKFATYKKMIDYLGEQYKRITPDTILSFGDSINPFAILANRKTNYPIYISDRVSPKQYLGWFKNFMKRITYKKASGIIAQSSFAAEYKRAVFGENLNMKIIPNSLRKIEPLPSVKKNKLVIGVGRLSIEKGFDRLIDAFARIEGHDEWQLMLVGSGPAMAQLEKLAETLGIKSRVLFLGKRKDVDELLAKSMIFVIPSRCEGFPNALCEAMASPLPCIAFDSIAADLIDNKVNGVIVKDGDIQKLADEMTVLMDDENLRENYASNAYKIRERLDPEKIGDEFLEFIL